MPARDWPGTCLINRGLVLLVDRGMGIVPRTNRIRIAPSTIATLDAHLSTPEIPYDLLCALLSLVLIVKDSAGVFMPWSGDRTRLRGVSPRNGRSLP
jgi:hypothetical protein